MFTWSHPTKTREASEIVANSLEKLAESQYKKKYFYRPILNLFKKEFNKKAISIFFQ